MNPPSARLLQLSRADGNYKSGYSAVGSAGGWECFAGIRGGYNRNAESLHNTGIFGLFPPPGTRRGIAFDHRNDHRQRNFQKTKIK